VIIWLSGASAPAPDADHGRGLAIVQAVSARWGYYYPGGPLGGKVVWARVVPPLPVRRPPAAGRRPGHRTPIAPHILARVKAALERLSDPAAGPPRRRALPPPGAAEGTP
jgi:hypothetical protein